MGAPTCPEKVAEMVRLYDVEKLTLQETGCRLGVPWATVRDNVKRAGVLRTPQQARRLAGHSLDERFFADIQTDAQAYWLGFLSADGYVCRRQVKLVLQASDGEHVQRWLDAVGSSAPCVSRFQPARIGPGGRLIPAGWYTGGIVSSILMSCDLAALGVVQDKSLTLRPWDAPESLAGAYYRGLIDGDGSFMVSITEQNIVELIGSYWVVASFAKWGAAVAGRPRRLPSKRRSIWAIRFSGEDAQAVIRALYDGATVWLPRKKEVADQILLWQPKTNDYSHITRATLVKSYARHGGRKGAWLAVRRELGIPESSLSMLKRRFNLIRPRPSV